MTEYGDPPMPRGPTDPDGHPPRHGPMHFVLAWLIISGLMVGAGMLTAWVWRGLTAPKPYVDPWHVWDDPTYSVRCYFHKDASNIVCIEVDTDEAELPPFTATRQP